MPKNYTDEFKRDVVAVAKQGAATQRQIAKDFGVSKSALSTWMRAAELQERGLVGPSTGAGAAGDVVALREALKRIRLLEQEAEVMRRAVAYLSQAQLPK
ncbi:transposase [Rhodoglobus vestalii]|uniref:Transposase n=1 Tax=Rhodoglobus vestalii TaxID=193384 RepID=A0A8H2K5X6_9MICO|nr:transposase [Rhodoglobus vestalii]